MSHRCLEEQELAALLERPLDDPRRREVEACARCAGLLAAVAAFLAGDSEIPPAEAHRADLRLTAFVAEHWKKSPADQQARRGRIVGYLGRPRWLWGAGLAAVAAMLILISGPVPRMSPDPSGTLRGSAPASGAPLVGELVFSAAGGNEPDGLRVDWPPVPGADHYQVILFSAALDTVGVMGLLAEPGVTLPGELLRRGGSEGTLCRVRALADGVLIAASRLRQLPNP